MTNVRDLVKAEVALQKKAMIWTHKQLISGKRVTIQQLASSLRVSVTKAEEVMQFLIYGVGDVSKLGIKLQIFVIDGKIPDWLRKFLNKIQISSVLRHAAMTTCTLIERDVHRKVLAQVYGDKFKDVLSTDYRRASDSLFNALLKVELANEVDPCNLDNFAQLTNPRWSNDRMTGRAGLAHHVLLDNGLSVHIHFGNQTPETLNAIDLSNVRTIEVDAPRTKDAGCKLPIDEVEVNRVKIEKIIENMRQAGYGVLSVNRLVTFPHAKGDIRTRILFAENTDIGTTIALTTPWTGLVFK